MVKIVQLFVSTHRHGMLVRWSDKFIDKLIAMVAPTGTHRNTNRNMPMLKYAKLVPYLPDLTRSRPAISDDDRERARARPPHAVPAHCRPWLDGQTVGWTLFYGFATPVHIVGQPDGRISVVGNDLLERETGQPRTIDQFAPGYFGVSTGYTITTPTGYVSLFLPATQPPPNLTMLTAVIETDWYPRPLFMVYHAPAPGVTISLHHGAELGRVVPIPRLAEHTAEPLQGDELARITAAAAQYAAEETTTPHRWTAAGGQTFTHLYKLKAAQPGDASNQPQPAQGSTTD